MAAGRRVLIVGVVMAVSWSVLASGQAANATSPLLEMLATVPSDAVAADSGWALVRYADYEALFAAERATAFRELGDAELLLNALPLGAMLSRFVAGPEALNYLFAGTGRMADLVGFEWLVDVDRSLEFGDPPDLGLLLGGAFAEEAIGTTLQDRGFEYAEVQGIPVWHRFGDHEISLADRDPADPFGGHLGAAARIALFPETLANARSWPLIEAIVSAGQAEIPSLADDLGYRALVETVSEREGLLIQALLFTGTALRVPPGFSRPDTEAVDAFGPLPGCSHILLADRQEDDDQVHLIGLVCPDVPTAQTASQVLAQRLAAFHPPDQPDRVFAKRYGASINSSVIDRAEKGAAIAMVEARYPVPTERTDPKTGSYTTLSPLFRAWITAILRREFTPLW